MPESADRLIVIADRDANGGWRDGDELARRIVEKGLAVDELQASFERFLKNLRSVLGVDNPRVGNFVLDEITFTAEIGANGEFKLLGTGVGISVTGGLTFVLRRQPQIDPTQP
jgi:hypothetical protein